MTDLAPEGAPADGVPADGVPADGVPVVVLRLSRNERLLVAAAFVAVGGWFLMRAAERQSGALSNLGFEPIANRVDGWDRLVTVSAPSDPSPQAVPAPAPAATGGGSTHEAVLTALRPVVRKCGRAELKAGRTLPPLVVLEFTLTPSGAARAPRLSGGEPIGPALSACVIEEMKTAALPQLPAEQPFSIEFKLK